MKTGIIVLGHDSGDPGVRCLAEECAHYLESRGRRNVRVSFHRGSPSSSDVLSEMCHGDGINTFSILPLAVFEGQTTVWDMPRKLSLPDNAGSWTVLDGTEIATRFSTALGFDSRMAEAIARSLGEPGEGDAVLLMALGSRMSHCRRDMATYSEFLRARGWSVADCYARTTGPDVATAVETLKSGGAERIIAVPMFTAFDGPSAELCRKALSDSEATVEIAEPISHFEVFKEILDGKVPEDW